MLRGRLKGLRFSLARVQLRDICANAESGKTPLFRRLKLRTIKSALRERTGKSEIQPAQLKVWFVHFNQLLRPTRRGLRRSFPGSGWVNCSWKSTDQCGWSWSSSRTYYRNRLNSFTSEFFRCRHRKNPQFLAWRNYLPKIILRHRLIDPAPLGQL